MKRDMELVRKLLIDFSNGEYKKSFNDSEEDRKYIYHLELLKEAGFITYKEARSKTSYMLFDAPRISWNGNDYLEAISNDTIWEKTKTGLKQKGLELGTVPINVIKEYAIFQTKQWLGME